MSKGYTSVLSIHILFVWWCPRRFITRRLRTFDQCTPPMMNLAKKKGSIISTFRSYINWSIVIVVFVWLSWIHNQFILISLFYSTLTEIFFYLIPSKQWHGYNWWEVFYDLIRVKKVFHKWFLDLYALWGCPTEKIAYLI